MSWSYRFATPASICYSHNIATVLSNRSLSRREIPENASAPVPSWACQILNTPKLHGLLLSALSRPAAELAPCTKLALAVFARFGVDRGALAYGTVRGFLVRMGIVKLAAKTVFQSIAPAHILLAI